MEIDAIGEIMNISLGSSATAVSNMLDSRVDITTPTVQVVNAEDFELGEMEPAVGVEIRYVTGLEGCNIMLLKYRDVKVIVDILMGMETPDEEFELNELSLSAVCEVMNQMMGAASTALSDFLGRMVNISTPQTFDGNDIDKLRHERFPVAEGPIVVVRFALSIGESLKSEFMNVMSVELARELIAGFGLGDESSAAQPDSSPAAASSGDGTLSQEEIERLMMGGSTPPAPPPAPDSSGGTLSQEEIERLMMGGGAPAAQPAPQQMPPMPQPQMQQMPQQMPPQPQMQQMPPQPQMQQMPQQMPPQPQVQQMPPQQAGQAPPGYYPPYYGWPQQEGGYPPMGYYPPPGWGMPPAQVQDPKVVSAKAPQIPTLEDGTQLNEEQSQNLDLIMSVPLEIAVEIGRTRKKVQEILSLSKGSLVVLDKLAGDQVDVYVNGKCIARGDVVVIDDNFGIRVNEIIRKPGFEELST